MIDLWPLFGVAIITLGMAFRLNTLLVILAAGVVTGLIASMSVFDILSTLGASFTKNRYMSLFILILPMIGILERYGLRERAENILRSMKNASVSHVLVLYIILRKITNVFGLQLGGHPSMIRPLIAPMAEAAAHKENENITDDDKQRVRALSAASENFANFFSQLVFIGAGGLLLVKGVLEEQGYPMGLDQMFLWAVPTMICSFVVFFIYTKIEDNRLKSKNTTKPSKKDVKC